MGSHKKVKTRTLSREFAVIFSVILLLTFFFLAYRVAIIYGKTFGFMFSFLIGIPIAFVLVKGIEHYSGKSTRFTKVLYNLLSILLGFIFFGVWAAVLEQITVLVFPQLFVYSPYLLPLYELIFVIIGFISAQWVRTKQTTIPVQGLKKSLRIAHISDIHVGATRTAGFLAHIVHKINEEKADIVAITGDIFDGSGNPAEWMVAPLRNIEAKTLAVLGNHDNYFDGNEAEKYLKKQDIDVLRGQVKTIQGIQFIGLDCPSHAHSQDPIPELKNMRIDKNKPSVLLYHMPIGIQDAQKERINVFLAGHTHAGGQLFPFVVVVRLFFKWIYGLYKIGGLHLYVSSGVGTWGPPFKFISPAEIVVHELVPKK